MRVILQPEVLDYLVRLAEILYEKQYLSWEETASKYVLELYDNIIDTLPMRPHHPAPRHFDPDGKGIRFASFRRSRATTWYVFFTKYGDGGEIIYLVHRIENNHTAAQYM